VQGNLAELVEDCRGGGVHEVTGQRDGDAGERAQGLGDLIHSGRLVSRGKRLRLLEHEHFPVHAEVIRACLATGILALTAVDSGERCERCGRAVTLLSIRSAPDGAV
jgi:hypothetical protein